MDWLTPARRKAIYTLLVAVGAILVAVDALPQTEVDRWLGIAGQVLSALGLLMAAVHTDTSTASGMPADESTPREGA